MIKKTNPVSILLIYFTFLIFVSCTPPSSELKDAIRIENTLKSVSLWYDSIPIEPEALLASFERVNTVIDSIGYPDAGYKLWLLQSDSVKNFRYLVEGYWPDQNGYNTIHEHELYKKATEAEQKLWAGLQMVQYHRFTKVNLK